jgi:hypothetical protein
MYRIRHGDTVGGICQRFHLSMWQVYKLNEDLFSRNRARSGGALVPDQGPVQQFTSAAADPPLHDRIGPRRHLRLVQAIGIDVSG